MTDTGKKEKKEVMPKLWEKLWDQLDKGIPLSNREYAKLKTELQRAQNLEATGERDQGQSHKDYDTAQDQIDSAIIRIAELEAIMVRAQKVRKATGRRDQLIASAIKSSSPLSEMVCQKLETFIPALEAKAEALYQEGNEPKKGKMVPYKERQRLTKLRSNGDKIMEKVDALKDKIKKSRAAHARAAAQATQAAQKPEDVQPERPVQVIQPVLTPQEQFQAAQADFKARVASAGGQIMPVGKSSVLAFDLEKISHILSAHLSGGTPELVILDVQTLENLTRVLDLLENAENPVVYRVRIMDQGMRDIVTIPFTFEEKSGAVYAHWETGMMVDDILASGEVKIAEPVDLTFATRLVKIVKPGPTAWLVFSEQDAMAPIILKQATITGKELLQLEDECGTPHVHQGAKGKYAIPIQVVEVGEGDDKIQKHCFYHAELSPMVLEFFGLIATERGDESVSDSDSVSSLVDEDQVEVEVEASASEAGAGTQVATVAAVAEAQRLEAERQEAQREKRRAKNRARRQGGKGRGAKRKGKAGTSNSSTATHSGSVKIVE